MEMTQKFSRTIPWGPECKKPLISREGGQWWAVKTILCFQKIVCLESIAGTLEVSVVTSILNSSEQWDLGFKAHLGSSLKGKPTQHQAAGKMFFVPLESVSEDTSHQPLLARTLGCSHAPACDCSASISKQTCRSALSFLTPHREVKI